MSKKARRRRRESIEAGFALLGQLRQQWDALKVSSAATPAEGAALEELLDRALSNVQSEDPSVFRSAAPGLVVAQAHRLLHSVPSELLPFYLKGLSDSDLYASLYRVFESVKEVSLPEGVLEIRFGDKIF